MKNIKIWPLVIPCLIILLSGCITPPQDESPIASIVTDDTTLYVGNYCVLDASDSDAGSGDTLIYNWEQDDSNPIAINIFETNHSKIKEIGFAEEGIYKFRLTVNNGIQDSKTKDIEINVLSREIEQFEDPTLEVQIRYILKTPTGILSESALLNVDSLRRFIFTGEDIYSLNGIEECNNIKFLSMSHQNISDISCLSTLYNLEELFLMETWKIKDISSLQDLTKLRVLELQCNEITDISPLSGLTDLTYLSILDNLVEDLTPLENLTKLEQLWISFSTDGSLKFIKNLDSLYILWMSHCNISDISPISNKVKLEKIKFSFNNIVDINPLENLINLDFVYLENNQIQDISALQYMPKIERYNLQNNLIENIEPLVNNKGLGEGDLLAIYGNPLDSISINEYIPALIDRGVIVYY